MATIASIAESVATPFGENYSDLDIAEVFDGWVADGLDEVLSNDEWPFLNIVGAITTVASQQAYVAPDSIWDIQHIMIDGDSPIVQVTRRDIVKLGYDLTDTGTPTHWFPAGVNSSGAALIGLWPIPSTADVDYTVVGGTLVTQSPTSTTALSLPPDIINLVKHYVREQYYRQTNNVEAARVELGRYRRKLPKVRKRHMHVGDKKRTAAYRDIPQRGRTFLNFPSDY